MFKLQSSFKFVLALLLGVVLSAMQPLVAQNYIDNLVTDLFSVKAPSLKAVGLPTISKADHLLLTRDYYATAFSKQHGQAAWVMWALTPQMLDAQGKRAPFVTDTDLPWGYQVDKDDYKNSGYSRGHMMPAADCKFSSVASAQCAYMSNICPQTEKLNAGPWNVLENRCRCWAKAEDTIYIVCGPVYRSSNPKRIGNTHKLDAPDAFFKVVLSLRKGHEKAIGFVMDNTDNPAKMQESVCTVADVERLTGLTFFTNLPADTALKLKGKANLSAWRCPDKNRQNVSQYNKGNRPADYQNKNKNYRTVH